MVIKKKKKEEEFIPKAFTSEKGEQSLLRKKGGAQFLLPPKEVRTLRERGKLHAGEQEALNIREEEQRAKVRAPLLEKQRVETLRKHQEALAREKTKREGVPVEELEEKKGIISRVTGAIGEHFEQPEREPQTFAESMKWQAEQLPEIAEKAALFAPAFSNLALGGGLTMEVATSKATLNTAKIATSTRATTLWTGVRTALKFRMTKSLGKYGGIGYALWSERSLSNIDSALSQVRESLTLPVSLAAANPLKINRAYDLITDLEDDINEYESQVILKEGYTLSAMVAGRTLPIHQRIGKLRLAIELARDQIAKIEASGIIPTDEELAFMLAEINEILDSMENPSKFLGIV